MINFHPVDLPVLNRQMKDTKTEDTMGDIKDTCSISPEGEITEKLDNKKSESLPLTGNPVIDNLITSGKIKKEDLEKLLEADNECREEEEMVIKYQNGQRENMKNTWINTWVEMKKAEKDRMKTLMALVDSMNKIEADIATNRMATNKSIQDAWFKAFFGDGK
jgi:hypothetical protein